MKALTTIIATFALLTIVACSGNDEQPAMDHSDHSQAQTMTSDTMHRMDADSMHTMAMDTSWACPMNCVAPQKATGKCSVCGMNLKMQVTAATDSTSSTPMDDDHSGHTH